MKFALVDTNDVVVNVIELEEGAKYTPEAGLRLVEGRDYAPAPSAPPHVPSTEEVRAVTFKADGSRQDMLARLKTATPAQIDAYIDANVTTLAQARTFLKALTKILATHIQE
jgi:hypothetical protein